MNVPLARGRRQVRPARLRAVPGYDFAAQAVAHFARFTVVEECGITGCIKVPLYGVRRLYVNVALVNQFRDDIFSRIKLLLLACVIGY